MLKDIKTFKLHVFRIWVIIFTGLLTFSCQNQENEVLDIALKLKANQCRILQIGEFVHESWTRSIQELEEYLPEELPKQERENILKLKNADLIRMFESYDDFDDEGHKLVDSMEQLDILWADSLRNLSIENQNLEMKMDSLLSIMDNPGESNRLYKEIEVIRSTKCEAHSM